MGIGETLNFFRNNTRSILPPQILFISHFPHSSSYPRILASKEKHLETHTEYRGYVFGTNRKNSGEIERDLEQMRRDGMGRETRPDLARNFPILTEVRSLGSRDDAAHS